MTPEDEEFERISREIRRNAAEDDDIQDYKKPWVGLTDEEIGMAFRAVFPVGGVVFTNGATEFAQTIERKLKEKNF
jgi:hypothetical protein